MQLTYCDYNVINSVSIINSTSSINDKDGIEIIQITRLIFHRSIIEIWEDPLKIAMESLLLMKLFPTQKSNFYYKNRSIVEES